MKWLRVGEEAYPTLEAGQGEAEEALPLKSGWPGTTLVISHSKRMAVNAAANRALAPDLKAPRAGDAGHPHRFELKTQNGCHKCITQNSPQSMMVWPGLRLIGPGEKILKGVFVAVAVEPDGVRLDNGVRLSGLPCAATCPSVVARAAAVAKGAIAGASALLSSFEASSAVTLSSRDWMAAALLPDAAVFTARSVT